MRIHHKALVALAAFAAACGVDSAANIAEIGGGVPPFDSLGRVSIGMTPQAISAIRPVRNAPYVGLSEAFGSGEIEYRFGNGPAGESVHRGELTRVTARYVFDAEEPARAFAKASFDTAVARLGRPVGCISRTIDFGTTTVARWNRSGHGVAVTWVQRDAAKATANNLPAFAVLKSVEKDSAPALDGSPAPMGECAPF